MNAHLINGQHNKIHCTEVIWDKQDQRAKCISILTLMRPLAMAILRLVTYSFLGWYFVKLLSVWWARTFVVTAFKYRKSVTLRLFHRLGRNSQASNEGQ